MALGINDAGVVVGYSENSAVYWDANGAIHTLAGSFAHGINNVGQIVGDSSVLGSGRPHAFIWDATSGLRDINPPGASSSEAYAINDLGQVVGRAGSKGFLWDPISGYQWITGMERADDVNDLGVVIGLSGSSPNSYSSIWDASNGLRDLRTHIGWSWPSTLSAGGINNAGQIVFTPEPGTAALLSAGLAMLARRRRQRAAS